MSNGQYCRTQAGGLSQTKTCLFFQFVHPCGFRGRYLNAHLNDSPKELPHEISHQYAPRKIGETGWACAIVGRLVRGSWMLADLWYASTYGRTPQGDSQTSPFLWVCVEIGEAPCPFGFSLKPSNNGTHKTHTHQICRACYHHLDVKFCPHCGVFFGASRPPASQARLPPSGKPGSDSPSTCVT